MSEQVWWLAVHRPDSVDVYELDADDDGRGDQVAGILAGLAVPADWIDQDGWQVTLSPGQPHPDLLGRATVHRADGAVTPPTAEPVDRLPGRPIRR